MFEVDERVAGPQPLPELVAGDDLAGPFEQRDQETEGLVGQVQPAAGLAQLTRADVQLEDAEPDNPARRFRCLPPGLVRARILSRQPGYSRR